jgi:hypothetical protein
MLAIALPPATRARPHGHELQFPDKQEMLTLTRCPVERGITFVDAARMAQCASRCGHT